MGRIAAPLGRETSLTFYPPLYQKLSANGHDLGTVYVIRKARSTKRSSTLKTKHHDHCNRIFRPRPLHSRVPNRPGPGPRIEPTDPHFGYVKRPTTAAGSEEWETPLTPHPSFPRLTPLLLSSPIHPPLTTAPHTRPARSHSPDNLVSSTRNLTATLPKERNETAVHD